MATGAAPALEPKVEATTETTDAGKAQPSTLKQRFITLLHEIFQGREEHLGWRQ
jgi:hypothetical protein